MADKSKMIDKLVEVYRCFAKYPVVTSARIMKSDSKDFIKLHSRWSQRNLEKSDLTKLQKYHVINSNTNELLSFPCTDVSSEQLFSYSNSEKYFCVLRECFRKDSSPQSKKKQYLEVWREGNLHKNFDVEEFDAHGLVYFDGEFGSLEWSPDESKILYIAEKKLPKMRAFYKQRPQDPKDKPDETLVGEEYVHRPDWGEQLVDKHQPVIGICDLNSETVTVLEGVPPNFSPGQVLWAKNGEGIYGLALNNEPRRLGLIYCTNRKGYIFYLSLKGEFKILSEENKSVRSPRLSPDGKYLYWLQRASKGPHDGCQELVRYNLTSNKSEIIVPIVRKTLEFCGIYSHGLPRRCFSNDGKKLFFSTPNKTKIKSYYVNLDTNEVCSFETNGSVQVLDVCNDMIVISTSTFQSKPAVMLSKSIENMVWIPVTSSEEILSGSVLKHLEFNINAPKDDFKHINAIYFGPKPSSDKKIPLIVYPHGGPHSCVTDNFSLEGSFLVCLGFGVLYVNYRGSTGAGEDGVNFLPGLISDTDVKDNHFVVNEILKELPYIDPKKIALFGGSHGGFLVAHLSAQYPDFYKAVVTRNPVIDVLGMYCATDIPDWNAVESGFQLNQDRPLTVEEATKMVLVSPIRLADQIKAPTYVMLGKKDLRVPPSQGLCLYYMLKARNIKTKLNVYDDNHSLSLVPIHLDSLLNATLWFVEHLGISDSEIFNSVLSSEKVPSEDISVIRIPNVQKKRISFDNM